MVSTGARSGSSQARAVDLAVADVATGKGGA
jgi:hypothetical protein